MELGADAGTVPEAGDRSGGHAGAPVDVLDAFESVPAIIWAFEGPELRVVAANTGARASAGFRPGIVGRPIREVLPELEGQQIFEMMEEAYAAGRPVSAENRRVLVDRDGDGLLEEGFFTYTFLPTHHADGTVRGLVVHIAETTAQALRQAEAERAAAASERRYRHASEIVLELQRSLLPTGVPVLPGLVTAAHYRVAGDELAAGGDWFDVLVLPDERVALLVGDVVGHGAGAAGAMGQLRAVALDALHAGETPAAALDRLDRFAARQRATRAAGVCLAVLDPATGELEVAAHAHPPPVVVDPAGGTRRIEPPATPPLGTGGPAAGWVRDRLAVGESLLLYSDGLVERAGRPLGETVASLAETVAAARRDLDDRVLDDTSLPSSGVERLATVVTERMGFLGEGYEDDVTLVLAERRPMPEPFELVRDAAPTVLSAVRRGLTDWLEALGAGDDDVDALVYAAVEAVTNVVQHAYGGVAGTDGAERPVRVEARLGADGAARLTVADAGRWRPPPRGPVAGGRGVQMMRELTDDTVIEQGSHGTTVRLGRRLGRPVTIGVPPPVPDPRPREEKLTVDLDEEAGIAVLSGPVDLTTADQLRAQLLQAGRGGTRPLCVDLRRVTVLSSAGVQLFHDLAELMPELRLATGPDGVAAAVVELTGLGPLRAD
ncbi:sigma-F factor regulator [Pseudonocardia yuanmonensis]|uniref:Sigma-F factor regulator n=1 Tax=Pseudonocardia yuanmonensis TaxID=1095914 RepID=A0ABP8WA36_9PSEU